jgi:hypothetical protein
MGPTNRAICLALALAAGSLMAAPPAAAWQRKAPRMRRAAVGRMVRKASAGRTAILTRRGLVRPPRRRVFATAAELPRPRPGTVRVYRGTGHPERLQTSHSMRGRKPADVPRGDQSFFGPFEATRLADRHAFGADDPASEAVSTTTDLFTAKNYAATNHGAVMIYDVPIATFERLPHGDRTMGEVIFRHSVPDEFLVGVLPVGSR